MEHVSLASSVHDWFEGKSASYFITLVIFMFHSHVIKNLCLSFFLQNTEEILKNFSNSTDPIDFHCTQKHYFLSDFSKYLLCSKESHTKVFNNMRLEKLENYLRNYPIKFRLKAWISAVLPFWESLRSSQDG